jgi:hypothetical protein
LRGSPFQGFFQQRCRIPFFSRTAVDGYNFHSFDLLSKKESDGGWDGSRNQLVPQFLYTLIVAPGQLEGTKK